MISSTDHMIDNNEITSGIDGKFKLWSGSTAQLLKLMTPLEEPVNSQWHMKVDTHIYLLMGEHNTIFIVTIHKMYYCTYSNQAIAQIISLLCDILSFLWRDRNVSEHTVANMVGPKNNRTKETHRIKPLDSMCLVLFSTDKGIDDFWDENRLFTFKAFKRNARQHSV